MYDLFAELFVGRRLNLTELFYRGVDGLIIGSGLENGRFYVTGYENCKLQRPVRVFVDKGEPGIEVDVDIIGTSSILLCKQMAKLTAKDYCNRVRAIWKKETFNLYVAIEDYAWDIIEWDSSSDARDLHVGVRLSMYRHLHSLDGAQPPIRSRKLGLVFSARKDSECTGSSP
jgi:hypothetical protein